MDALIELKKEVFYDLRIPWDKDIERKFAERMSAFPNGDPEIVLDNITSPYLNAMHKKETYVRWLKEQYGEAYVNRRMLKFLLGKEVFEELLSSELLVQKENAQSYRVR